MDKNEKGKANEYYVGNGTVQIGPNDDKIESNKPTKKEPAGYVLKNQVYNSEEDKKRDMEEKRKLWLSKFNKL